MVSINKAASRKTIREACSISLSSDSEIGVFDQVGIATTTPGINKFQVGGGSSLVAIDSDGIGIGTTANGFKLRVLGESKFSGSIVATAFTGDGSGLTNINAPASGWTNVVSGGSSVTYNTNIGYGGSIGIGTSSPAYLLTVGAAGTETTSLYVNGPSEFVGLVTSKDVTVGGGVILCGAQEVLVQGMVWGYVC